MEVLVADGVSSDGTREIAEAVSREYPVVRVIDNPGRTAPAALNRMIHIARGQYILRFDAHSEMPRDYIRKCVELLESTGAWNVGGAVRAIPGAGSAAAEAIVIVTTHRFGVGNSRFRIGGKEGPADTAAFGAYPREVFSRIGLFDERLVRTQDYEFNARIRKAGGVVWFSPKIRVDYRCQSEIRGLCRKGFRNGLWVAYGTILAPYSVAARHYAPAAFVCGLGSAIALRILGSVTHQEWLSVTAALLPLPYLVLWAWVSTGLLKTRSLKHALRAAWIFPAFHLSYGAGAVWGFVSAIPRLRRSRNLSPAFPVGASGS
jgi:GT2 family glycosyltransferase